MNVTSIYPVLMTDRVEETATFYRRHLGFEETFSSDWYVSLRHSRCVDQELAVLQTGHGSIPEGYSAPCQGVVINIEVTDAGAEYERLVGKHGLPEVSPLRDEEFGQRHFIVSDPAGNLVDVIENIEASEAYAENYAD